MSHVLPPSREMYIESLVTMTVLIVVRVDPDLIERIRRLAAGDVDLRHLPPRLAAVVGPVQLVADDALRERRDG